MRIELQKLTPEERSDRPFPCWLCGRQFVTGRVAAWANSITPVSEAGSYLDCGPLCPACLEEGPEKMAEHLEWRARWSRFSAEDDEMLIEEGIEAPTVEELRLFEWLASPVE